MSNTGQRGYDHFGRSTAENTDTVTYSNPRLNAGYSPDGLVELLGEDDVDWDGYDWDEHPFVQGSGKDTSDWAKWDDMSKKEKKNWTEERRKEGNRGAIGESMYDKWVEEQGTTAKNGVIDKDYYMQDPLYAVAFAEMGITGTDWELEDLKKATMMVVDTYKAVVNGDYKVEEKEWDVDPGPPWKPEKFTQEEKDAVWTPANHLTELTTVPEVVMPDRLKKLIEPGSGFLNASQTTQMKELSDLKVKAGSNIDLIKSNMKSINNAPETESPEVKKGLGIAQSWEERSKDWENHIDSHPYKKVGEAIGLKKVSSKNDFDQIAHWASQAGVATLDSNNDVSKIKDYVKKDAKKKAKKEVQKKDFSLMVQRN